MSNDPSTRPLRTCVSPQGRFVYGLHRPSYSVTNLRVNDHLQSLGRTEGGQPHINDANFPSGDVQAQEADAVFEMSNPFPFRGSTFIGKAWADRAAENPGRIAIHQRPQVSLSQTLAKHFSGNGLQGFMRDLPRPLRLAVAATSTDPTDLVQLAQGCCEFVRDPGTGRPKGLIYKDDGFGCPKPKILDEQLFDTIANNPYLPNDYKAVMVLRPGAQGQSEIVGEWRRENSHVFEYLRRNSYIPWGHYAANMADDAVRYAAGDLLPDDILGLRHLYYQRTYTRLAEALGLLMVPRRAMLPAEELEKMRQAIQAALHSPDQKSPLPFSGTLWGWNYGFDYASNGYRLHASHQQVHQQYALIPENVPEYSSESNQFLPTFACGDMIHEFIQAYHKQTGQPFFECYLQAITTNRRMDRRSDRPADLVVHQDEQVMLFVPKAQTSQWELQLMPMAPVGNILEADAKMRRSLDQALLTAMRILTALGATMITVIEYSKRFAIQNNDQRLLYAFLPRLPESPGAFSEAQLRWINGHYPEDFAQACRLRLDRAPH